MNQQEIEQAWDCVQSSCACAALEKYPNRLEYVAALRHEMAVMAKMIELIREGIWASGGHVALESYREQAEAQLKGNNPNIVIDDAQFTLYRKKRTR